MSVTAAPTGFHPIGTTGGTAWNGATRLLKITNSYGTSIFYGDVVKMTATGTVEKDTGTATATPVGIFLGCQYTDPSNSQFTTRQYWAASTVATDAYAFVCDDPDAVFQIQADGSVAQAGLGANFAIVQGTGSTITGNSAVALDADSANTTNTLPCRLVDFVVGPDSAVGDAYTDCIVRWNVGHAYRNTEGI